MGEINKDPLQKALDGLLRFLTRITSTGAAGNPKCLWISTQSLVHKFYFPLHNQLDLLGLETARLVTQRLKPVNACHINSTWWSL